ncbi:unnamed protein product [Umbelopsis vinacea]
MSEMNHYVKDESDPDYKQSLQVANWQREDLEEQYPLCDDCARKVEQVLKEKNVPAARRVDEEDDSWLDLIPDPEPFFDDVFFRTLKDMEWEYWQYWTVFSLASLYWLDWEPLTLRWYGHDRVQLHNFQQYKLLAYGMLKLTISFVERPSRAITGRSIPKTKPLVREKSELQRTKPAWQPMKFARRLREAVVRYVPAIEFYGLNGFGWSDDIFEPNPPPNEEFFKKNAMVLMEEMKDMDYATDSDSEDNDSDEIISGLSWRPRTTVKSRKRRSFVRPSPLTTKSEIAATKRYSSITPTSNAARRRLPLDYLDSDDEYDKDASDSDEDVDRSHIPWRPHRPKPEKLAKTGLFERMQVRASSAPCTSKSTAYSSQKVF